MRTLLFLSLVTLPFVSSIASANAADEQWVASLSPGLIAIDLVDGEDINPSYQWGLSAGQLRPLDSGLALSFQLAFEHTFSDLEFGQYHRFRLGPEARIGLYTDSLFVYGLLGVSVAFHHARINFEILGVTVKESDTEAGLTVATGGGAELRLTDQFGIGAELQLDVDTIFEDGRDPLLPLQLKVFGTMRF